MVSWWCCESILTGNDYEGEEKGEVALQYGNFSVGVGHKCEKYTSSMVLTHTNEKYSYRGGVVYHLQSTKGDVAAQVTGDFSDASKRLLEVGIKRVEGEHTYKAKLGSNGKASVSLSKNLDNNSKITTALHIDTLDLGNHKLGFEAKFTC